MTDQTGTMARPPGEKQDLAAAKQEETRPSPSEPSKFTDEERQAYAETKQRQRDELEAKVKDLASSFRDSDTFKDYLSKMSEFNRACSKYLYHYSPSNLLFIMAQDPTATIVGSFHAWRNIGRHVEKGEQSHIQVWAPVRETVLQDKLDEDGNPVIDKNGDPVQEPVRDERGYVVRQFSGHFTLKPVYDISQTDGEPLPKLADELSNPVENFEQYAEALKKTSPLPIHSSGDKEAAPIRLGEAKGVCSYSHNMIVIKEAMAQEHTLKTMVHEIAHAMLHGPGDGDELTRAEREAQAEGTAYVVCDHFGFDTSDYSIPYLVSWSEDEKLTNFTKSLGVILDVSDKIIDSTETELWKDMGLDAHLSRTDVAEAEQPSPAGHEPGVSPQTAPVTQPMMNASERAAPIDVRSDDPISLLNAKHRTANRAFTERNRKHAHTTQSRRLGRSGAKRDVPLDR